MTSALFPFVNFIHDDLYVAAFLRYFLLKHAETWRPSRHRATRCAAWVHLYEQASLFSIWQTDTVVVKVMPMQTVSCLRTWDSQSRYLIIIQPCCLNFDFSDWILVLNICSKPQKKGSIKNTGTTVAVHKWTNVMCIYYNSLVVDLKSIGQASRNGLSHQFAEMDSLPAQSVQQRLKRSLMSPLHPSTSCTP